MTQNLAASSCIINLFTDKEPEKLIWMFIKTAKTTKLI